MSLLDQAKREMEGADKAAEQLERDAIEAMVAKLAKLPPLEYERIRKAEARKLGIRPAALDAEIRRRRAPDDESAGQAFDVSDPEPWPHPVDGVALLDALAAAASQHIILPPAGADAIALWILHSHAHDTAAVSPVLGVTSPTPECGKTTLLTFLGALVPRALECSNVTSAALFRAVEKWHPTLLIDEGDTFLRDNDSLRGILNSGHLRSSAYILRNVGEDHEPRRFRTWAPKAIALIGKLPSTLTSRAIHIEMRRMHAGEHIRPLRADRLDHLVPYLRQGWRWTQDHADTLRAADPELPGCLRGRTADNWRHLVALADAAGGDWPTRARRAAECLSAGLREQTAGIMLLEDLRGIFTATGRPQITSVDICQGLASLEDRPWPEWGRTNKPITARQLARLLEAFDVRPTKFRADGLTPGTRGYTLECLADAFDRYLPPLPSATPPQPLQGNGSGEFPSATEFSGVADTKAREANGSKACGAVAVRKPQKQEFKL